jgi:hypothetical protein
MLNNLYHRSLAYFSQHAFMNSLAHSAGGFGLAILLRNYLEGDMWMYVAWAFIGFSVIVHLRSIMR